MNYEALIEAGILEKVGGWYRILKMDELPSHAKAKISSTRVTKDGQLYKFRAPSKQLVKFMRGWDKRNT